MDTLIDIEALTKLGGDRDPIVILESGSSLTVIWEPGDATRYVVSARQVAPAVASHISGAEVATGWQITLWGRSAPWVGASYMTFPGCRGVNSEDIGEHFKCNPHTARVVGVIANTAVCEFDRHGEVTAMDIQGLRLAYPDAPGFAARLHIA